MEFKCDQCGQSFTRRYNLKVHKLNVHSNSKAMIRMYLDEDAEESYPPLERSNAVPDNWKPNVYKPGLAREESLRRTNGEPDTSVSKRNPFRNHALAPRSQTLKFQHPFCMLVAEPSRSGKTQWTMKLLKERHQRIEPLVDSILFCYSQ